MIFNKSGVEERLREKKGPLMYVLGMKIGGSFWNISIFFRWIFKIINVSYRYRIFIWHMYACYTA